MKHLVMTLSFLLFIFACANRNKPEDVADAFVHNYYQRANQEAALLLSHSDSLAADKLKDEIALLRSVRDPTQVPNEMPQLKYEMMGKKNQGENQVFFRYQLTIKRGRAYGPLRDVVIQTELSDGKWKVVNYDDGGR